MGACLRHVKTIIRNQFFWMNFDFKCSKEERVKENSPNNPIREYNDKTCSSVPQFVSYSHFYKCLIYFLYILTVQTYCSVVTLLGYNPVSY